MTSALTAEAIAELKRLDAEATAGPWEAEYSPDPHHLDAIYARYLSGEPNHICLVGGSTLEQQNANTAVIPAARNALPALLSELEQSRVERKEMMQVLTEVKEWIGNWDPPFTQDEEWPATSAKIDHVLSRARQRTCVHEYEALDDKGWECKLCGHQT